ncbi:MAG: SAM-dependent methyltransferase, partial [Prevotella sp.]|nr:SAM-dependent methyltransferase [Prevotella sp.]
AAIVRACGNGDACVNELLSIKRARMSIEHFERLSRACGYTVARRTLWFINPHYQQKFGLKPRRLNAFLSSLKYIRNFYTTSAFYLLRA